MVEIEFHELLKTRAYRSLRFSVGILLEKTNDEIVWAVWVTHSGLGLTIADAAAAIWVSRYIVEQRLLFVLYDLAQAA